MITDVDHSAELLHRRRTGHLGGEHELGPPGPVLERVRRSRRRGHGPPSPGRRPGPAGQARAHRTAWWAGRWSDRPPRRPPGSARGPPSAGASARAAVGRGPVTVRGGDLRRRHRSRQQWWRGLVLPQETRQVDEPLGHTRGQTHHGDVPRLEEAEKARFPLRVVLHVGPEQRLDLPPAGGDEEQSAEEPDEGPGADAGALPRTPNGRRRSSARPAGCPGLVRRP